ncbi:MAG: hypothetical protein B6D41_01060 [Chloroflexi bacterium UTCFX4]|jgi:hypothetical protein|nr:MAG: hypothetical protein B6D41_01060 [Chloroflexi bacterium UTCFX4]
MVKITELVRFGRAYANGPTQKPAYAFSGGSAVQCWLHTSSDDREHYDIDVFAFNHNFLKENTAIDPVLPPIFIGRFTQNGIIPYSEINKVPDGREHIRRAQTFFKKALAGPDESVRWSALSTLHIIWGSYFDSQITPSPKDVRSIIIRETLLLALSPEFVLVSKLSYPNVHNSIDLQDALRLNRNVHLDRDYVSQLLSQTSLDELIDADAIFRMKTEDDKQALVDFIHHCLIRRFLHSERINVEALNSRQIFMLLDVHNELFQLPPFAHDFIDRILSETTLSGRELHIARIGLYLLTSAFNDPCSLHILSNANFRALVQRGLALIPQHPTSWLIRTKIVFTTLRELANLGRIAPQRFEYFWSPVILECIVQRILFDGPDRFALMASLKLIHQRLKTNDPSTCESIGLVSLALAS